MKFKKFLPLFSTLVLFNSTISIVPANAASLTRQISSSVVTAFPTTKMGTHINGLQLPEIAKEVRAAEITGVQVSSAIKKTPNPLTIDRSHSREHGIYHNSVGAFTSPIVKSTAITRSNPGLFKSFNGLNLHDQRLANDGNQFSVEPPDQGLCAGNGFVMESVNTAMQVYDTHGKPATGVIDLNTFYGYPAQINRTTGESGPFITDPSCYYDPDVQRWFQVVLTLDIDPITGDFLGSNHIDIAVSTSAKPTGSWVIYRLPVQNDGTDGTPNHSCSLGPCIGDYPHIGADKYGFYVTTNEYSLFGPDYTSAQIYAFSKAQLAANAANVTVVQFDTTAAVSSAKGKQPGFTVWPAVSPANSYSMAANGTEFFMSSNSAEEANNIPGGSFSNELIVWALSNTKSLNSVLPNLKLTNKVVRSETYGIPPQSEQKAGNIPLADCLNLDCFGLGLPPILEVEGKLDSLDSRMQQVWYSNGQLWGALSSIVTVNGQDKAGIAHFRVMPNVNVQGKLSAEIANQGYVAVSGNNLLLPAIAVLPNGKGIISFTLVGQDYYPSAGYVPINKQGTGAIHVAAAGLGPQDGFSEYLTFGGGSRWGDYGAAVTDGNTIWMASEYIAQTCTIDAYQADSSCGGTRVTLGNWATRITGITPN